MNATMNTITDIPKWVIDVDGTQAKFRFNDPESGAEETFTLVNDGNPLAQAVLNYAHRWDRTVYITNAVMDNPCMTRFEANYRASVVRDALMPLYTELYLRGFNMRWS